MSLSSGSSDRSALSTAAVSRRLAVFACWLRVICKENPGTLGEGYVGTQQCTTGLFIIPSVARRTEQMELGLAFLIVECHNA